METLSANHREVAEPDQMASGVAGTGRGNEEPEWAKRHIKNSEPEDGTTGLPMNHVPKEKRGGRRLTAERLASLAGSLTKKELENHGDLVFLLFDCMDLNAARQNKKDRQSHQTAERARSVNTVVMTRKRSNEETEIPLQLQMPVIARQIRLTGDTINRIGVKRMHWYHYHVPARTKAIRKEFAPLHMAVCGVPGTRTEDPEPVPGKCRGCVL